MTESVLKAIRHYCAYQERCHSDVRHRLLELNARGTELEEIMAALIAEGFLNEERFAKAYCGGKFRIKQWGRKKIIRELKQKQVSDYCIQKALKEIDEDEYRKTLLHLAIKKKEELGKEASVWARNQKIYRYLLQRGFEWDVINEIMPQIND